MSGTQILNPYFLLSSTDNIFPCVKEHFWYFRCMYIIWCSLLAYTTKIPDFKVRPQSKSGMAEFLVSQRLLGVVSWPCRGTVRILPGNVPEGIFQAFIRSGVSNHRMEVQMSVECVCASHQWCMKWCLPAGPGKSTHLQYQQSASPSLCSCVLSTSVLMYSFSPFCPGCEWPKVPHQISSPGHLSHGFTITFLRIVVPFQSPFHSDSTNEI